MEAELVKDFEQLKQQLSDITELVNSFKSEQVQLRIVEAFLAINAAGEGHNEKAVSDTSAPHEKRGKTRRKTSSKVASGSKPAGPRAAIEDLISAGFFKQRRGVSEVVLHLKENRALTFKQQVVQLALNRLVRAQKMQRGRNAENNQFEYWA